MPSPVYNNFQNLITFSRASNATLVDATGRITYAPNNLSPYINYTGVGAGFWNINSATVTQNNVTAPDGTLTAARIVTDGTTINQGVYLNNVSVVGRNEIFSVYLRGAVGGEVVQIGDASARTNVTLTTSWVRYNAPAHAMVNANNIIYAQANTAMTFYVWGPQTELVTYQTTPSTYNPTTTAAYYGPRLDYDPATLALKGLLVEEARTNLITYSEQFDNAAWTSANVTITTNAIISPSGTTTAEKIVIDAGISTTISQGQVISSGAAYTGTVYAKAAELSWLRFQINWITGTRIAWFNLSTGAVGTVQSGLTASITNVGNGWYRCSVSGTSDNTTGRFAFVGTNADGATINGNGTSGIYLWGAQLEAGSFATSYIPTVAASVARSADLVSMTGSQFAPWYNRNAGTFVMSLQTQYSVTSGLGVTPVFLNLSNITAPNGYVGYYNGLALSSYDGTNIANAAMATWAPPTKFASAYGGATKSLVVNNGTLVSTAYNGAWSAGTELSTTPRAWIQSITYYPRTLSNSQLQSLTS